MLQPTGWGQGGFGEEEEHAQFLFRFLLVVLANAVLITGVFSIADALGGVQLSTTHRWAVRFFLAGNLVLLALLWGQRERWRPVCWAHWWMSLGLNFSGLLSVPEDELRVLWFFMHLSGSFILLGARVGVLTGAVLLAGVLVANGYSQHPYSPAAMVTLVVALLATTVMFWAYARHMRQAQVAVAASRERLRELALRDPLTGVLNARAFQAACEPLIHRAAQPGGAGLALLFIDLDHFKRINDQHGHDAGDTVLRAVATCLQASLRAGDVLGRVGGEEFCILAPHLDSLAAMQLGERLRAAVEALGPDVAPGQRLWVTASIGVATQVPSGLAPAASLARIQRDADQAMYRAKAGGRNRVTAC